MPLDFFSRSAPVVFKPCVTSTNTLLKGLASCGVPDGFVLAAAKADQRPRPSGARLLNRRRAGCTSPCCCTPVVRLSVCRRSRPAWRWRCAVRWSACGVTPEIKWPNDLLINGKKLCGILVESSTVRGRLYVVIGMGLNINTAPADFPEELRDTAGSLFGELGRRFELEDVAAAIIEELDAMYAAWQTDPACCLADYRRLCVSINRPPRHAHPERRQPRGLRGDIDESYAPRRRR